MEEKKPSGPQGNWNAQLEKIIGLGESSLRKTYYPELQQKLDELERFRALLDQSNDCIFLLHVPSWTFVDVNESACRQLGCSRQEVLSVPWDHFFPEEAVARARELLAVGLEQGWDRDTITTRMLKCSGEELPVEVTLRLVTFNKELYGVAVARDITEANTGREGAPRKFPDAARHGAGEADPVFPPPARSAGNPRHPTCRVLHTRRPRRRGLLRLLST